MSKNAEKARVVKTKDDIIANVREWRRSHRNEVTFHPDIDPHFEINIGEKLKGAQHARRRN